MRAVIGMAQTTTHSALLVTRGQTCNRGVGPTSESPKPRPSEREVAGVDWVVADGKTKVYCKVHPDSMEVSCHGCQSVMEVTIQGEHELPESTNVRRHRRRTSRDSKVAWERTDRSAKLKRTSGPSGPHVGTKHENGCGQRRARASRAKAHRRPNSGNVRPRTRRRESPMPTSQWMAATRLSLSRSSVWSVLVCRAWSWLCGWCV